MRLIASFELDKVLGFPQSSLKINDFSFLALHIAKLVIFRSCNGTSTQAADDI
jgi:hypothetical protein